MGTTKTETRRVTPPSNSELANHLQTVSRLLLAQGANRFRAEAYQRAAETLRTWERPVWQIYESEGINGLEELPGIGRTISRALQQLIRGGHWALLDRLQGNHAVERTFASVSGIGPKLAERIHDELEIETLAELQAAAWDGRLRKMAGIGEKRVRAVCESLAQRGRQLKPNPPAGRGPTQASAGPDDLTTDVSVAEILEIDQEYRNKAAEDRLPRIAPRQFNPTGTAWLPVLHTRRGHRHYTALFSNTGHAHAMGMTHDWVVIYLEDHQQRGQHGRWTVITSRFGKLRGRRIVRGRETECMAHYASQSA